MLRRIVRQPVAQDLILGEHQAVNVDPRPFALQRQDSRHIAAGVDGFVG
jgi:hypothetical protein